MRLHVIIMCKAPIPGAVKTRLIGRYSPHEAACLHSKMATAVIQRALRLFDAVFIAADDPGHSFFSGFNAPTLRQGEGDLGSRMNRLMLSAFDDGAEAVMFLGTDSPHMKERRLLEAAGLLHEYEVVLGPVEDGGYDLIALISPQPVFSNISWSTERVTEETVDNIRGLNLSYAMLDKGFDIDHEEDLERAGWGGA